MMLPARTTAAVGRVQGHAIEDNPGACMEPGTMRLPHAGFMMTISLDAASISDIEQQQQQQEQQQFQSMLPLQTGTSPLSHLLALKKHICTAFFPSYSYSYSFPLCPRHITHPPGHAATVHQQTPPPPQPRAPLYCLWPLMPLKAPKPSPLLRLI